MSSIVRNCMLTWNRNDENNGQSTPQITINVSLPPFVDFYQWNDLDFRVLRVILEESKKDSVDVNSSDETSTLLFPQIEFLMLIFIRYLQLISVVPWASPLPIDGQSSATTLTPQPKKSKQKNKKARIEEFSQPGLCGLTNIGNTCFMNSAIQCLSNIPKFTEWAKKYSVSHARGSVTQAYTNLIKSMWSGKNTSFTPSEIKRSVSRYAPIFTDYAQKDSHEFMNSLLNALHCELQEHDDQSSIVTDLFRIQTESRVTCLECQQSDPIEESLYCLPLPLGDEGHITLDSLVNDFTKEEELNGDYYCIHCQDLRSARQKTSICSPLPPVIIVQLRRFPFDGTNDKINSFVEYPLSDWQVIQSENSLYDLCAVSMHVGNLKYGHYTTLARSNGGEQWYLFNDSHIEPIDNRNILVTRNAYVLVYLKKELKH